MRKKQLLSLLLASLMLAGTITGCGKNNTQQTTTNESKTEQPKAYSGLKVVNFSTPDEPKTLDAQKMTGAPEMNTVNMFMEGLTRNGKKEGDYIPGVAKTWTFDKASNTWTFELRKDSKWTDGTPVTAADFIFGWRYALDDNAPYSFMLAQNIAGLDEYSALTKKGFYASKDANFKALIDSVKKETDAEKQKEIKTKIADQLKSMPDNILVEYKKAKDDLWAKSGVKDKNGNLEVKLAVPCPYFIGLTAFAVFYPVNQKFFEQHQTSKDYCLEAAGLNSNGPWKMEEWKHKDSFKLVRNENYWNKANVKIDVLELKMVKDVSTRTNLLKTCAIDGAAIQSDDLKTFQDQAVREQFGLQDLVDFPDYTVFYLDMNHTMPIFQNANIKKAIAYALDRKGLVTNINVGDAESLSVVPNNFKGLNKSFREEYGPKLFEDNSKDKAKEFLKKGLAELKMDKLPALELGIDSGDIGNKNGQKTQSDLKEIGIDVTLVPLTWADKLKRLEAGEFQICGDGWGPDYLDPMTFLDLFESTNGNNYGKYNSEKYDKLIDAARKEWDPKKRMDILADAEKLLIEDMAIAPTYNRTAHVAYKNYLTGVVNRGVGPATDFYFADIDMAKKMAEKNKK